MNIKNDIHHFYSCRLICIITFCMFIGAAPVFGDDSGSATVKKLYSGFNAPVGMGFDSKEALYVAEWGADRVVRISKNGDRKVFAGGLESPSGLAVDDRDHVFVASYSRNLIYEITPEGRVTVFAKGFATPAGLSFNRKGNLLVANRRTDEILLVSKEGNIKSLVSGLETPVAVVETVDGHFYISNINGGVSFIENGAGSSGSPKTVNRDMERPGAGIVATQNGDIFVVDYGGTTVNQVLPGGSLKVVADGVPRPAGLTMDKNGALYAAAWGDGCIYRIKM